MHSTYNPYIGVQNPYGPQNPYAQQNPYIQEAVSGYQEISTFCEPSGPSPLTCCRFDPFNELLWTGTNDGRIVSYETPMMEKYSSWSAFNINSTIKDIIPLADGVLSLCQNGIKFSSRGGITLSCYLTDPSIELNAMLCQDGVKVLFGGSGDSLYLYDLLTSSLVREYQIPNGITCLKRGKHLYAGTPDGKILFCDPRSNRIEQTFSTHYTAVNKLICKGDILVASGSNANGYDSVLKTFDIRSNRPLNTINMPFNFRVSEIGFHPKLSTTLIATSFKGSWQMVEAQDSSLANQQRYSINSKGRPITSFDIAASGEVFAFSDIGGLVHLFSDIGGEDFIVNQFSQELEYPDEVFPTPYFDEDGDIYSSIDLYSYPSSTLLSNWNGSMFFSVPLPPEPVLPLDVMERVRFNGYLGVLQTVPGSLVRNKVSHSNPLAYPSNWDVSLNDYIEQQLGGQNYEINDEIEDVIEIPTELVVTDYRKEFKARPPKHYQFLQIKQNIKGYLIDMTSHNTTALCGLDNTSPRSYMNALFHVYYWTPALYYMCRSTIMDEEDSVITELGLLFNMMDESEGGYVEARNFFRVIQNIPSRLLLLQLEDKLTRGKYFEKLNTLFLEQIVKEELNYHKYTPPKFEKSSTLNTPTSVPVSGKNIHRKNNQTTILLKNNNNNNNNSNSNINNASKKALTDQVFGSVIRITNVCLFCNNETVLETHHSSYNLNFPEIPSSFSTVLVNTLYQTNQSYAWCENCQSFQLSNQRKEPVKLPNILTLNCSSASTHFWSKVGVNKDDDDDRQYNKYQSNKDHWIPFVIEIILDQKTKKLQILEVSEQVDINSLVGNVYILNNVISNIHDWRSEHKNHIIAQIQVTNEERCKKKGLKEGSWYLFNDFKISATTKYDAVTIDSHWKTPIMLNYTKLQKNTTTSFSLLESSLSKQVSPLDDNVFFTKRLPSIRDGHGRNKNHASSLIQSFFPLKFEEFPLKPGSLIALDTEYFRVIDEDQRLTTNPSSPMKIQQTKQMSFGWARVSVLRSWGNPKEDVFIDDYISTDESKIQDYLTQFSGLRVGDLDPNKSPHHVVSHKMVYLKMRRLVDIGCIFVGHGLKQDFSIINLYVKRENIIDTVDLYYLPGNRRLSLRFLAQVFLGTNIQQDIHDSIEDARTALLLYKNYVKMKESLNEGYFFEDIMKLVYYVGEMIFWKSEDFHGKIREKFVQDLKPMCRSISIF